jgi:recombination associated protein RdgC
MLHLLQTAESPGRLHGRLADGRRHARGLPDRARVRAQVSDEQKSVVRYARHALDIDEVRAHLTSGKMPTRLALSWKERVAFTLTETLTLKKISFLDLAFEGRPEVSGDESFDADLALATGELGTLIPALIEGLGGEHDFTAAALGTAPARRAGRAGRPARHRRRGGGRHPALVTRGAARRRPQQAPP